MSRMLGRATLVLATACGTVTVLGTAAVAAPPHGGPSGRASCVGQVFAPQATAEPGTIPARIRFIKDNLLLEGENFGDPISGLARDTWCRQG